MTEQNSCLTSCDLGWKQISVTNAHSLSAEIRDLLKSKTLNVSALVLHTSVLTSLRD